MPLLPHLENLHLCFTRGILTNSTVLELNFFAHSMSIFLFFAPRRTFTDVAHSRFQQGNPKLCLMSVYKMLVLVLSQIATRVFPAPNSIQVVHAQVGLIGPVHTSHFCRVEFNSTNHIRFLLF